MKVIRPLGWRVKNCVGLRAEEARKPTSETRRHLEPTGDRGTLQNGVALRFPFNPLASKEARQAGIL